MHIKRQGEVRATAKFIRKENALLKFSGAIENSAGPVQR